MREILLHHSKDKQQPIRLFALDEPEPGFAPRRYGVSTTDPHISPVAIHQTLQFIGAEAVPVPLTNEALIAILIDRLECWEKGQFTCAENFTALESLRKALSCLKTRTKRRQIRGVEGKAVP